jgi:FkbM family methyltransferase
MGLLHSLRKSYYRAVTRHVPRADCSVEALRPKGFASQYGQDKFVAQRLGNRRGGVFFEIGAFDGVTLSNTYYLETQLGWTGIAVEPSRAAFAQLQARRKCRVVNGCIADAPGRTQFLEIAGAAAMLSGRIDRFHPRHRSRIAREIAELGGQEQRLDVPCFTVEQLAREAGLQRIDYLSVDTEGGELAILQSIDFRALDIRLVTVENNYADLVLRSTMRRAGFELIAKIACDEVYEHRKYL